MLFDLQGKRRRVVQATYLTLAVLMGGGLVFFGVGSDATGGLADIFTGDDGGGSADGTIEKRIERNEERAAKPGKARENALKELVRDHYALATAKANPNTGEFGDGVEDLERAAATYQRYLKVEDGKIDPATASFALRVYDVGALNKPAEATEAAAVIAADDNDWQSYVRVVQYATLAGDARTADLAGQRAIDLAGRREKAEVRQQVKAAKKLSAAGQGG